MDVTSEGASTSTAVRLSAAEKQAVLAQPSSVQASHLFHGLMEAKEAKAATPRWRHQWPPGRATP